MSELDVLQKMLHDRTEYLHRCQAQHAELALHGQHNDPDAVALLTELFANWGAYVTHGVFDQMLQQQVMQFQDHHGVHPADGVVRHDTWAALAAMLQAEVTDLQHKVANAGHGGGHGAQHGGHGAQHGGHGHHDAPAEHPTWGSDDGTGHYQGPIVEHPPHPNAPQLQHYVERATNLLHAVSGAAHTTLSAHGHNDGHALAVLVDCFRLFDEFNAFDTVNPGLGWGSAGMTDHEYGHSLQSAVHRYQEVNSLHPTGDVDPATWAQLGQDLQEVIQHLHYRMQAGAGH